MPEVRWRFWRQLPVGGWAGQRTRSRAPPITAPLGSPVHGERYSTHWTENACCYCTSVLACIVECKLGITQFQCSGRCLGPTTTVQKRSVICQHANGSLYTDCVLTDRYTHTQTQTHIYQLYVLTQLLVKWICLVVVIPLSTINVLYTLTGHSSTLNNPLLLTWGWTNVSKTVSKSSSHQNVERFF